MQWSLFLLILMGQSSFFTCHLYEYHFIKENKNWKEAQKYCKEKYTDLATVFDMTDMKRLDDSVNQREAWIGLYRKWHWSLRGVEYYENETWWEKGEPNDANGDENCVVVMRNQQWFDAPCETKHSFICNESMKPSETLHLIKDEMTWPEAQKHCRQHYTDLFSGHKQLKKFNVIIPQSSQSWIGLFRITWRWSDGSNSSFRNWENLEVSNYEQSNNKCVTIKTSGKWGSDNCNETKPFFCYEGSSTTCDLTYHFIDDKKTWNEAQTYCKDKYTDLATVFDETDMKRLGDSVNQGEAWIGLYNNPRGGKRWQWSLPGVEYYESETRWKSEEPNDGNCVFMKINQKWFAETCKNQHSFICYNESIKSDENFHLINEKMTWAEAQNYCREHHTDLISGYNQLEELNVEFNEGWRSWIGLFRDTWSWSDGSNFTFRNGDNLGQTTSNNEEKKNCAVAIKPSGKWGSDKCNQMKPFVCYEDKVILIKEEMTWDEALYHCREQYEDLASITDIREQRWIQERAKKASTPFVWLGLRYTCTLDFWFWVNNAAASYENWASNTINDDCDMSGAMESEGQHKWVKKNDTEKFNFICSKY